MIKNIICILVALFITLTSRCDLVPVVLSVMRAQEPEWERQLQEKDCGACDITVDGDGALWVADQYNKAIWRIEGGAAKRYAGKETEPDLYGQPQGGYVDSRLEDSAFGLPWAIAPFLDGFAVSDAANNAVRLVRETGVETLNGRTNENLPVTELGVSFEYPTGLAADDEGNLYVSDTHRGAVRRISKDGLVTTAVKDLDDPMGLCWSNGTLYIAETGANRIIALEQTGETEIVAGSGEEGREDGSAMAAQFSGPQRIFAEEDGTLYISDTGNGAVRCIKDGSVTTLIMEERLFSPAGVLIHEDTLFVCDSFTHRIHEVNLGGLKAFGVYQENVNEFLENLRALKTDMEENP